MSGRRIDGTGTPVMLTDAELRDRILRWDVVTGGSWMSGGH
jgi:hypothetical protein